MKKNLDRPGLKKWGGWDQRGLYQGTAEKKRTGPPSPTEKKLHNSTEKKGELGHEFGFLKKVWEKGGGKRTRDKKRGGV